MKIDIIIPGLVALMAIGCAKEVSPSTREQEKAYFDAWIGKYHPELKSTGLGVYIMDDQPGTGDAVTDDDTFLFVDYTITDLEGNVSTTSLEKLSQQVGSYSAANYYGANVLVNNRGYTERGVLEMIKGMRIGGKRTAIIPSWLNYTADYETAEEYLKNNTEGTNAIYTISVLNKTTDITKWELDTLERYVKTNMSGVDSIKTGYYYKMLKEPTDTAKFSTDTTYRLNYTGRLLNGHVFDTSIEDTAKVHGIWNSQKTYAPVVITMNDEYSKITLAANYNSDGSTVVDGFAFCLSRLRPHEKGVCAFYAQLGYGASGSGSTIPAYAPLVFEIESVDDPDN